jgi:hypothetical protein
MGAYSFSGTAASNTTVDGIGAAGSDSPDNIDNLVRALAASDANLVRDLGGANTVAGTADAATVALADASTPTYFDGMRFSWRVGTDNATTTPTLNVDSLGAKTIKKSIAGIESPLAIGDLQAGMTAEVVYRSAWASAAGAFELLNPYVDASPLRGYIHGLTLSNNGSDATNDIDIAVGECTSDASPYVRMALTSALTKRLDASWAVGTNQGGLDTGSIADTTYHIWLIQRSDTGVVDALFSTSATSPTMPTNYDRKRRIGSIRRSSGAIVTFSQVGDVFRIIPVTDMDTSTGVASGLITLSIPAGINVYPILTAIIYVASGAHDIQINLGAAITGSANIAIARSLTDGGNYITSHIVGFAFLSNTSAQIYRSVVIGSGTLSNGIINTAGWIDTRGKDA